MNWELKFSRRIHPWPKVLFNLHGKLKPYRKYKTAKKYGEPINAIGDHLHIYLTLRCQYKCYYCVNLQYVHNPASGWTEISGKEWLKYLNRLYNLKQLYLQGGEPLLHPDFEEIINGLDNFNICIYTNLPHSKMDIVKLLNAKNNNVIMLCSYHAINDKRSVNEYVEDFNQIPKGIKKHVHLIDVPEVSYKLYASAFRRYGIFLERQDCSILTEHNPIAYNKFRRVFCNSHMEVVSPDMNVYRCLGLMLRKYDNYTVHLKDYNFVNNADYCDYYGLCGQCSTAKEIWGSKEAYEIYMQYTYDCMRGGTV